MLKSENGMFGRESEISLLNQSIEEALASKGSTIILSGEAGIGKSALVNELISMAKVRSMGVCLGDCTEQDTGIPYIGFQRALSGISGEELFSLEEFTGFDELFLISKIGLLISHVSRSEAKGMDEDILGSMLTAVQDFVKDSFGGGENAARGGLGRLEYMNTKITIEHGDQTYLAVVTSGEEHPEMRQDIRRCLASIEEKYFDILNDWDGDIGSLSDSSYMLGSLVEKKYRVKRSLDNINIQSERLKVQNRIYDILESASAENGLILILEDIHWADESTLLAIPYISRNILGSKILFCITCRSEDTESNPGLSSLIGRLKTEAGGSEVKLSSLADESVRLLAYNLLGGKEPPDELIGNLVSETQGNPFFITEAVRALISEGSLFRDGDIWFMRHSSKSVIPHSVVELVSRRLETLELDCFRLLEYGAILGRRFGADLLAYGFGMGREDISKLVEKLITLNILTAAGEGELMFQHSKIQEVIYSEMNERLKRMSHRNAGINYERIYRDRRDEVLFNLAYHFSRTFEFEKGIDYSISAGYKASDNLAPREASQFFQKAIELMELSEIKNDRYPEINQTLAELYELDGNYEKAVCVLDKILRSSEDAKISSCAMLVKGRIYQSQGRYDDAIITYGEGMILAEKSESSLLRAKISGNLGKVHLRKGEYEKAMELQKAYLSESQKADSKLDIGQAQMNIGGVYWSRNEPQMAIRHWELSLSIFENEGYRQGIANLHDNLGVGYRTIGDVEKSLDHYKRAEKMMALIGDVRGMSMVLLNLGVLHNHLGDYDTSLEYNLKSLQIKKKIGDRVGTANIYNNIGGNYQDMERYAEALEYYWRNHELMSAAGDTWGTARALNNISMVKMEMGAFSEAEKYCLQSLAISEKHSFNDICSYSYLFLGVIASHGGDDEYAERHFEKGLSLAIQTDNPVIIGKAHLYMARHDSKLERNEKAMDHYAKSYEILEKSRIEADARKVRREMQSFAKKMSPTV